MSTALLDQSAGQLPARSGRGAGTVLILAGRAMVAAGLRLSCRRAAAQAAGLRYREYEELRGRLQALGHSGLPLL
jgi:hypothetical protein